MIDNHQVCRLWCNEEKCGAPYEVSTGKDKICGDII
jgi:hypothetical protein